jgi:diguanylate cyclase (GGDEF)-like protein
LTGLPNRVLLDDRLAQAIVHAERSRQQFAVMVLDLDRFKFINDSLGHHAGDDLLNRVATRLRGVVHEIDTVARIGGDEFVLVISSAAQRAAGEQIAQRVIDALKSPVKIAGVDLHISTSIGMRFIRATARS